MKKKEIKFIKTFKQLIKHRIVEIDDTLYLVSYVERTWVHNHKYVNLIRLTWDTRPALSSKVKVFSFDNVLNLEIKPIETDRE